MTGGGMPQGFSMAPATGTSMNSRVYPAPGFPNSPLDTPGVTEPNAGVPGPTPMYAPGGLPQRNPMRDTPMGGGVSMTPPTPRPPHGNQFNPSGPPSMPNRRPNTIGLNPNIGPMDRGSAPPPQAFAPPPQQKPMGLGPMQAPNPRAQNQGTQPPSATSNGPLASAGGRSGPPHKPPPSNAPTHANVTAYIKERAPTYGVDPDVAVRAYNTEGAAAIKAGGYQSTVSRSGKGARGGFEDSHGPFQLYMGGGLGNQAPFDVRDASTWKQNVDFALSNVAKSGWGAWYGPAKVGITGFTGVNKAGF